MKNIEWAKTVERSTEFDGDEVDYAAHYRGAFSLDVSVHSSGHGWHWWVRFDPDERALFDSSRVMAEGGAATDGEAQALAVAAADRLYNSQRCPDIVHLSGESLRAEWRAQERASRPLIAGIVKKVIGSPEFLALLPFEPPD